MNILLISALEILDSRGTPTLQVEVMLDDGSKGTFRVPSGASTGIHEAHELRDEEKSFLGKGVSQAKKNVFTLSKILEGNSFSQKSLDKALCDYDGTENKSAMGANAILGISIAFAKAAAQYHQLTLHEYLYREYNGKNFSIKKKQIKPNIHLFANVINGGLHAGNKLMVQEFMLIPDMPSVKESIQAIAETYQHLKKLIGTEYGKEWTAVGDEGGFAPNISTPEEALNLLQKAVDKAGYTNSMYFALDAAASDFYDEKSKKYEIIKGKKMDYKELSTYYNKLITNYPLISIEDPFSEDDFTGFEYFMKQKSKLKYSNPLTGKKVVLVVGDDLLVTNPQRMKIAQKKSLCNSLLLKINQIGTLSEALEAHHMAEKKGWHTIVSHRSGETTDSFISDLAYALEGSIKLGAPARGERVAKYNRLLEIYRY